MPQATNNSTGRNSAFLSAFVANPVNISFATQDRNETIILFLRKHPITNLGWILLSLLIIIAPIFFFPFFEGINLIPFDFPESYAFVFNLFWYLGTFAFVLFKFVFWYYNVNIVTDKRVVDIDFIYLLYNENTATTISKIEDVTAKVGGFFRSLFNYGDVMIQTAGTEPNIEFIGVPHPSQIVKIINELMDKIKPD